MFRTARLDVEADQLRREKAVYDMQIAQLKTEMKEAKAERKAKLQATIDQLNKARQKKIEHAKQQLEQIKKEHDSKVQALKGKATLARGEAKAAIDARITELNQHHQETVAKWKNAQAEKLEKGADQARCDGEETEE